MVLQGITDHRNQVRSQLVCTWNSASHPHFKLDSGKAEFVPTRSFFDWNQNTYFSLNLYSTGITNSLFRPVIVFNQFYKANAIAD